MAFEHILQELSLLLRAPFIVPEMWWIAGPLIAVILVMTFYFGRYIQEKLGWNTALGNSVVLFFVGIDLLRTIFNYTQPPSIWNFAWHIPKVIIIFLIMIEAVFLSYTAFKHAIPDWIMFFIASPLSVNLQAYVLATIVYLELEPTMNTLYAALLLFAILLTFFTVIREIQHVAYGYHLQDVKEKVKKEIKKKIK